MPTTRKILSTQITNGITQPIRGENTKGSIVDSTPGPTSIHSPTNTQEPPFHVPDDDSNGSAAKIETSEDVNATVGYFKLIPHDSFSNNIFYLLSFHRIHSLCKRLESHPQL